MLDTEGARVDAAVGGAVILVERDGVPVVAAADRTAEEFDVVDRVDDVEGGVREVLDRGE